MERMSNEAFDRLKPGDKVQLNTVTGSGRNLHLWREIAEVKRRTKRKVTVTRRDGSELELTNSSRRAQLLELTAERWEAFERDERVRRVTVLVLELGGVSVDALPDAILKELDEVKTRWDYHRAELAKSKGVTWSG